MEDDRADARADTRWLSYGELADARGISRESAIRIARRRGWPRRTGNDGTVRVAVPRSVLEAKRRDRPDLAADNPGDNPPDISSTIKALEGQIDALKGQMAAVEAHNATLRDQAADLKAERDRALHRADTAEVERDRMRERIEELERQLGEARARVREGMTRESGHGPDPVRDAQAEKLWHEIADLQAKLEEVRAVDAGALHQSARAGEDSDHSPATDPHQVERLWQRVEELEHRLEEARAGVQKTNSAENEQPDPSAEPGEKTNSAEITHPPDRPRRWWRRMLRRSQS